MDVHTKIDVEVVSQLAKLPLSEAEKTKFSIQLEEIMAFVDELSLVDTTGVNETAQVTEKNNEKRDDIAKESLSVGDVVVNAPQSEGSFIVTKGVFDES